MKNEELRMKKTSGSGFRVPGSGFRVPGSGFRVPGSGSCHYPNFFSSLKLASTKRFQPRFFDFIPEGWSKFSRSVARLCELPPETGWRGALSRPARAPSGRGPGGNPIELASLRWWRVQSHADHRLSLLHPFRMRTWRLAPRNRTEQQFQQLSEIA